MGHEDIEGISHAELCTTFENSLSDMSEEEIQNQIEKQDLCVAGRKRSGLKKRLVDFLSQLLYSYKPVADVPSQPLSRVTRLFSV